MSTQEYDEARSGWLTFAAVLMFAVGFVRIISAIRYFDDGQEINDLSAGLFGGWSLLSGGVSGRVVGYVWGVLVIVQGFLILEHAPWYGAAGITLAVLVVYGLASTSGWRAAEVRP